MRFQISATVSFRKITTREYATYTDSNELSYYYWKVYYKNSKFLKFEPYLSLECKSDVSVNLLDWEFGTRVCYTVTDLRLGVWGVVRVYVGCRVVEHGALKLLYNIFVRVCAYAPRRPRSYIVCAGR